MPLFRLEVFQILSSFKTQKADIWFTKSDWCVEYFNEGDIIILQIVT